MTATLAETDRQECRNGVSGIGLRLHCPQFDRHAFWQPLCVNAADDGEEGNHYRCHDYARHHEQHRDLAHDF